MELLSRAGLQQRLGLVDRCGGIEPRIVVGGFQDHRHAVVQRRHEVVGVAHDDRSRDNLLAPNPGKLPDSGEGERLQILAGDTVWLLAVRPLLPLEEARCRDLSSGAARRLRGTSASSRPSLHAH